MGRIGVFLCDCPFSPLNAADAEELLATVRRRPDVAYAGLHPDICLNPAPEKIAGVIAENGLEGAVFTCCSSMLLKDAFASLASAAGLAHNKFAVVDFNEQTDGKEASESLVEAVDKSRVLARMLCMVGSNQTTNSTVKRVRRNIHFPISLFFAAFITLSPFNRLSVRLCVSSRPL